MNERENLLSKRNILVFFVMLFLIISIPIALTLVKQQQSLKSRASGSSLTPPIQFSGPNVTIVPNNSGGSDYYTSSNEVEIQLGSPFAASTSATQ